MLLREVPPVFAMCKWISTSGGLGRTASSGRIVPSSGLSFLIGDGVMGRFRVCRGLPWMICARPLACGAKSSSGDDESENLEIPPIQKRYFREHRANTLRYPETLAWSHQD